MKTIKRMMAMMMAAVCMNMGMSSCNNDKDDDEVQAGAAKCIEDTYTADMTCSVMGSESTIEGVTMMLMATSDNTVDVNISDFGNPPMAVPSFTVSGLTVTGSNGVYTIAPKEFSGTTDAGKAYSGTMQGSFANNTLNIKFNLQYGAMPMPMVNTFIAVKP